MISLVQMGLFNEVSQTVTSPTDNAIGGILSQKQTHGNIGGLAAQVHNGQEHLVKKKKVINEGVVEGRRMVKPTENSIGGAKQFAQTSPSKNQGQMVTDSLANDYI